MQRVIFKGKLRVLIGFFQSIGLILLILLVLAYCWGLSSLKALQSQFTDSQYS